MAMLDRIQGMFRKNGADDPDLSDLAEQDVARIAAERLDESRNDADFAESRLSSDGPEPADLELGVLSLPVLGRRSAEQHRRTLGTLLLFAVVLLTAVVFFVLNKTEKVGQQVAASGQALMQSQRLAKSVSQALIGNPAAFAEVKDSADVLSRNVRGFKQGDDALGLSPLGPEFEGLLGELLPKVDSAERNAGVVLSQQKILTQVGDALRSINRQSSDLLEIAETVSSLKLQLGAPSTEISAAGQLVMLTQRIGKSANEFLTMEGVSPEAVFLLGKDLNTFKEIAEGLLNGSAELRLKSTTDPQIRERLEALLKLYEQTRTDAGAILGNLQGLVAAREAQAGVIGDSEPLRTGLESLQSQLSAASGLGESSQEIGEITELISDITEQTNVLALNAAIQAASAGEAGRGFSVVAEEVQRLAERSADATRQIAALVKAIQTDTQDAVAAMERSTQGVVEGAKLSDNAGTALSEIDRVSRRLAELIEQISSATLREAESANEVAGNIQHIFAVTEQTGEGTRSTAAQVRELSSMAEELRQSVARFKIA